MEQVFEFINENTGAISIFVTIILAVVPGTLALIKWQTNRKLERTELNISDLSRPESKRLTALDGMEAILDADNDRIVFPLGFNMDLELSHNGRGSESITVRRIEVDVENYEAGERLEYERKMEGANIFGAGSAADYRFYVSLFGKEVDPATWIINAKTNQTSRAKNRDLLSADVINKEGHRVFYFDASNQKSESLRGTVLAKQPGFYEIIFSFYYSIGAADLSYSTNPVYVYSQ